jgi:ribosomal protein S17
LEEYDEVEQIEQEHMMMVMKVVVLMEQHVSDDVMEKTVSIETEHMLMTILYRMVVVVVENYLFHCYGLSMMAVV